MQKLKTIIIICLIVGVTFFIFQDSHKQIYIENEKGIEKYINTLKEPEKIKEYTISQNPNTITITYDKNKVFNNYYKELEKNAALLFNKVKDLNIINFNINDKTYVIEFNNINSIFNNDITLENIKKRYNQDIFLDFIYIGNVNEYDILDKSEECGISYLKLYEDDEYNYEVICSSIEKLYLIKKNETISLKEALKQKKINIDDLFNTELKIVKEAK